MKISLSIVVSSIFIISFMSCFSGCISLDHISPFPVPKRFKNELRGLDGTSDKSMTKYTVKKGDTIWKISKDHGVQPDTLIDINNIYDVRDIKTGRTLLIPTSGVARESRLVDKPQTVVEKPPVVKNDSSVSRKGYIWPIKNRVVGQYGEYRKGKRNTGIDIEAKIGDDVLASKDGKVKSVAFNPGGWGKTVVIEHERGAHTWYAFNSKILVKKNARVRRGQVIAKAGKSARTGKPGLHFKVFRDDKPVNPLDYLGY